MNKTSSRLHYRKQLREAKRLGWIIRLRADKDGYSIINPNGIFCGGGSLQSCEEYVINCVSNNSLML
jgi:hypothetical protein